eukprot:2241871-Prymnesium_polylepis.1
MSWWGLTTRTRCRRPQSIARARRHFALSLHTVRPAGSHHVGAVHAYWAVSRPGWSGPAAPGSVAAP